jgi:hypothetical protein
MRRRDYFFVNLGVVSAEAMTKLRLDMVEDHAGVVVIGTSTAHW